MAKQRPKVTRIYHDPVRGMVVEEVFQLTGRPHMLDEVQRKRLQEFKRRAGLFDTPLGSEPVRVVRRKPAGKASRTAASNAKRNGRKRAA